jgi:hypothetical protein
LLPAPAHDDDRRRAARAARGARGRAGAGALHEDVAGRPVLDRPAVERAHLGGGDAITAAPRDRRLHLGAPPRPCRRDRARDDAVPMFSSTISACAATGPTLRP